MITNDIALHVLHYTPLESRKNYLETNSFVSESAKWITESHVKPEDWNIFHNRNEVFGLTELEIGRFFRTNTFHLRWPRVLAHSFSKCMFIASFASKRFKRSLIGSKPPVVRLSDNLLEFSLMHIVSLREFVKSSKKWYLFCEDDSRFGENFVKKVELITFLNQPIFVSLASGSGLKRKFLDPRVSSSGIMKIKPSTSRGLACSIVHRDQASKILRLMETQGIPDWLPIDLTFSLALYSLNIETYWSCPAIVEQGSQSGAYQSNFR